MEDKIMEITQSEQQTERQKKKMKAIYNTYGIIYCFHFFLLSFCLLF